jgi:hypothetical protein
LQKILYIDLDSHDVKSAQDARYDEGMNDVADPHSTLAWFDESFPAKATLLQPLNLNVPDNLFPNIRALSVPATGEDSYLFFSLQVLSSPSCILERTPAAGPRKGRRQLVVAYDVPI